jgi:transposase
MRYELADYEWTAIRPMLPNKPRGVPRVNDRRVLNGIFWVLRSGAPWRDLPVAFGPYTTCYNRFVRWRRAGVCGRIIDALAATHDAAVQMIDTSIVRVHQHGSCVTRNQRQSMGRSRDGLTSKIHAVVDSNGLPVRLALSPGEAHDVRLAGKLLSRLKSGSMLLADRGYDADWIRELAMKKGAWANIPPKSNRSDPICFSPYLYRARAVLARIDRDLAGRADRALRTISTPVFWLSFLVRMPFRCSDAWSRATPPLREAPVSRLWHASYDRDSMAKAVDSTIGGGALSGLSGKKAQAMASDQAWQQFVGRGACPVADRYVKIGMYRIM